eukprot:TRINITY_DN32491_c0_g1_i1.p1 TRINITY_DN32491_c0_g1~~TRINITY_DN32491_c0_g1_i1.p1  ORF type:complete len:301 (+),score=23.51 TRINITY_DN32491_c0_g1_i1:55-957(+)
MTPESSIPLFDASTPQATGNSCRTNQLPSIAYASSAVLSYLRPEDPRFTRFGTMPSDPPFKSFYPWLSMQSSKPLAESAPLGLSPDTKGQKVQNEASLRRAAKSRFGHMFNYSSTNFKLVSQGFLGHIDVDGTLTVHTCAQALEDLGIVEAKPYAVRIFQALGTEDDALPFNEILFALDAVLNGRTRLDTCKACFHVFEEEGSGFITKQRVSALRSKRLETEGCTHLMIKSVLSLIDGLEKQNEQLASAKHKRGRRLPPVNRPVNKKTELTFDEFVEALTTDPWIVQCWLPQIILCLRRS